MGTFFQDFVDIDIPPDEADAAAREVLAWLIERQVLAEATSDCVLGSGDGHAPGERYQRMIAMSETTPDMLATFESLHTNGGYVASGRVVGHPGQGATAERTCPYCGESQDELVSDEIFTWWETGVGDSACPCCGRQVGLNEWRWREPWAFGYLHVEFWNWPWLSAQFEASLSDQLSGHRIVRAYGKL